MDETTETVKQAVARKRKEEKARLARRKNCQSRVTVSVLSGMLVREVPHVCFKAYGHEGNHETVVDGKPFQFSDQHR